MELSPELLKQALSRYEELDLLERFDGGMPGSRPNSFQAGIIQDFTKVPIQIVKAGNQSGKSTIGARLMAHLLAESLPGWSRPENWGKSPLLFIVVGRTSKQVEDELYKKIRGFFKNPAEELQEVRQGMMLQKVVHRATGNTLLLASHHSENEAREKLQSFVANAVWLDEMPGTMLLFEELLRRVQSRDGYFIATFTPKVKNQDIRRWVDNLKEPYGRVYKLPMMANPILSEDRKKQILMELEAYPEDYRQCVLEGDWLSQDASVYQLLDSAIKAPEGYHGGWRHVESSDPALQSKHGQVVFAENPQTKEWYVVKSDYITGIVVPEDLVLAVTQRVSHLNVVRRVCDSASTWYIGQASKMGFKYHTPWDKNNRKDDMMKNVQTALGSRLFIAPWCHELISELTEMQWSETAANKIINVHRFHLHDATIYGLDCLPKPEENLQALNHWGMVGEAKKKTEQRQRAKEEGPKRGHLGMSFKRVGWRGGRR